MAVYTIELGKLLDSGFSLCLDDYQLPSFLATDYEKGVWRDSLNEKSSTITNSWKSGAYRLNGSTIS